MRVISSSNYNAVLFKMAMPVENSVTSTIARLLNLNAIDTNAYEEAFEEYFGERDDSENELSLDADESSEGEYKSNLIQSSSSRISRSRSRSSF